MSHDHLAPWGQALKRTTGLSVLLLGAVSVLGLKLGPHPVVLWRLLMVFGPVLGTLTAVLFLVRGYSLHEHSLEIERFGWTTKLPLAGLKCAAADPLALRASRRLWGNGGFFAFTGLYANSRYGRFRLWATDLGRAVVLQYVDRTIIVTPEDPARFVREISRLAGLAAAPVHPPG